MATACWSGSTSNRSCRCRRSRELPRTTYPSDNQLVSKLVREGILFQITGKDGELKRVCRAKGVLFEVPRNCRPALAEEALGRSCNYALCDLIARHRSRRRLFSGFVFLFLRRTAPYSSSEPRQSFTSTRADQQRISNAHSGTSSGVGSSPHSGNGAGGTAPLKNLQVSKYTASVKLRRPSSLASIALRQ